MHSDHRHPGSSFIRAALAVSPMRTMCTVVLLGERTSSGDSKSLTWTPAMRSSLSCRLGVPVEFHGPSQVHRRYSSTMSAATAVCPASLNFLYSNDSLTIVSDRPAKDALFDAFASV